MKKLVRILLVEDDKDFGETFALILKRKGYEVVLVPSALHALRILEEDRFDIVVSDVVMPQMNGLNFVKELKARYGESIPIIMLSGYGNVKEAVEAMKLGAYSYFLKPANQDEICLTIDKAVEFVELKNENMYLREEIQELKGIMLHSNNGYMKNILAEAATLAQSDVNVLIMGESGTGKEVLARYIHEHSQRRGKAFMPINCQAYVETLLESELFGYKGGAFTGASSKGKPGKFEMIKGGTLFLDEIGELQLSTQVKLLRVLETKEFEPIGSVKPIAVNFRLLSATNRDIDDSIKNRTFREDLFYRINTVIIKLPPLRDRPEDIIPLARNFLQVFCIEQKKTAIRFTTTAENALVNYAWPGNIRELRNVVEAAVALSKGVKIDCTELRIGSKDQCQSNCYGLSFAKAKENFEREFLRNVFSQCNGNISFMARTTYMDRKQLYKKLTEYKILEQKGADDE
ncbi:MAG: two component, sigma54 specific, Fis family transcriptional regulator [Sporomusa sp.]|jgi:DNA-binding NtrC family response regulator|nr:two component, sigma54 specific, Fis family transcriptional regulator [Sporomusa sp.]